MMMDGLMSTAELFKEAWCPTVYDHTVFICRPLELEELLRLYQFPLDMDKSFRSRRFTSLKDLPFLDYPPAEMVGAIL